MVNCNFM